MMIMMGLKGILGVGVLGIILLGGTTLLVGGIKVDQPCTTYDDCNASNYEACGFTDTRGTLCQCGTHSFELQGRKIQLHLTLNETTRQCQGPLGYPCKTAPLFGSYEDTCASGLCGLALDSCLNATIYAKQRGGVENLNLKGGWIRWILLVGVVMVSMGLGISG